MPTRKRLNEVIAAGSPGAKLVRHIPLHGGVSADVTMIEVELPDGSRCKWVLREHGVRHCGHRADVEFRLLSALHALGLPVARPIAFDVGASTSSSVHPLPFVLIEYVEGSTPIPAQRADARIDTMADQLYLFHTVPTDTLPDLPLRIDPQAELFDFLSEDTQWDGLRETLRRMGPQPFAGTPSLLHGDYWPANIIFHNEAIAAVIDWEDAGLGDPISDVACAMLELRYIFGPWGAQRFAQSYAAHRLIDPHRLALWQAYVAAAGAKSMAAWGLEPIREARMQSIALETLREAARALLD